MNTKSIAKRVLSCVMAVICVLVLASCGAAPKAEATAVYNSAASKSTTWNFGDLPGFSEESFTLYTYSDGTYMLVDEIFNKESPSEMCAGGGTKFAILVVTYGTYTEREATTDEASAYTGGGGWSADGTETEAVPTENFRAFELSSANRVIYSGSNSFYSRVTGYLDTADPNTFEAFNNKHLYADNSGKYTEIFETYGGEKTLIVDTTWNFIQGSTYYTNTEFWAGQISS